MSGLAGVVLAAGLGTRLRPLTAVRPKPLCPLGSTTLLDAALARVAPHVVRSAVNAHHLADQVVAHVGRRAHVSVEERLLGTGGALARLRPWLDGAPVLLHNGDAHLGGSLDRLVEGWDGERCRLLVVPAGGPADFGEARYVGACLLPPAAVASLPDGPGGLYEPLWRPAWEAGRLELVEHDDVAVDCGTPADYLRANLLVSGGRSVVGTGAVVEGELVRSVVWPGGRVARGEVLVESVRVGADLTVDARVDRAARG
ncbi:nucleotidyltransferase family protein [Vallicoccus soli]|uniref:Nucleotidyl transferase n=1 Tax=Vallicoccus soli TaxID=2339232 RepID=A0A3A3YN25_9ACTN|nr:sugar phosphate nucleotidyltransferase [Vallicoccus soli]RJK92789.1 nucleotidyl transferase [Vallicoccus soli]